MPADCLALSGILQWALLAGPLLSGSNSYKELNYFDTALRAKDLTAFDSLEVSRTWLLTVRKNSRLMLAANSACPTTYHEVLGVAANHVDLQQLLTSRTTSLTNFIAEFHEDHKQESLVLDFLTGLSLTVSIPLLTGQLPRLVQGSV